MCFSLKNILAPIITTNILKRLIDSTYIAIPLLTASHSVTVLSKPSTPNVNNGSQFDLVIVNLRLNIIIGNKKRVIVKLVANIKNIAEELCMPIL